MRKIIITKRDQGQRLDKLTTRYLNAAPSGFVYKMLRKKNITLNGKKALGNERLVVGDEVCLYLSEETLSKFACALQETVYPYMPFPILYEDPHVLIADKPAGMLSQKAGPSDVSLNEYLIGYLLHSGQITGQSLKTSKPSVCNRLDRNTSGIVLCGKTILGLQEMSRLLKERNLHKYYHCIVGGSFDREERLRGFLKKDERRNEVSLCQDPSPGAVFIEAEYTPLRTGQNLSLVEVLLITGRSHQIRAQLAAMGFPIVGDLKYGDPGLNRLYRKTCGVKGQLLHAARLEFPELSLPELSGLSRAVVTSADPPVFEKLLLNNSIYNT